MNQSNYKKIHGLTLSNVGVGTYLGDATESTDILVKNAVKDSILSGINVIDTAINYRSQKAERSVGKAISELIQERPLETPRHRPATRRPACRNGPPAA